MVPLGSPWAIGVPRRSRVKARTTATVNGKAAAAWGSRSAAPARCTAQPDSDLKQEPGRSAWCLPEGAQQKREGEQTGPAVHTGRGGSSVEKARYVFRLSRGPTGQSGAPRSPELPPRPCLCPRLSEKKLDCDHGASLSARLPGHWQLGRPEVRVLSCQAYHRVSPISSPPLF
ncbi:unnamed protein product [Rangifer tarandus platyrhynchus]|uniref:Uncharacterized protein n=1 Tax=Rangifer tarandus platyrhynchus TaxID=3082113 RepID=A0AC59Y4T8_RANTA